MTRTTILFVALAALAGCGGGGPTITVGGMTMTVHDQGWFYTNGTDYCPKGGSGQILLDFVDYNYLCDPTHAPDRAPESPHLELRIILTTGLASDNPAYPVHPNMGLPYDSTPGVTPDCLGTSGAGGGDTIIGEFVHFPNGHADAQPDSIRYATSAHLLFTQFDKTKAKPLQGNYDLKFGNDEVKSSFSVYACN